MPVYSMTGYASATAGAQSDTEPTPENEDLLQNSASLTAGGAMVELRSVNSRFLDLGFRLADELRSLEPTLRELLSASFKRGKIELRLTTHRNIDTAWSNPQPEQLNRLNMVQSTIQSWLPKAQNLSVHEVLQWCKGGDAPDSSSEKLSAAVTQATRLAIQALLAARASEGEKLVAVLSERIERLRVLADQAEPLVPAAVQRQQQRFLERWQEALEATGGNANIAREALQERALNEAAAYAIRIDVAEELARLRAHLDELTRLLNAGGAVGKRLDFLIQELLREANTLGSKASSLELTNISVEMKMLIEQLREQVQNLE
jgi:uncharacterized protein (TIGR00255 family)